MTIVRFAMDRGCVVAGKRGRILRIRIGPGAGYVKRIGPVTLRGYTAWIGFNVFGGRGDNYVMRPFSTGCTGNANHVPWARH